MSILAFLYEDYYCYGIRSSFAGEYSTEDSAKRSVRPGRGDNLELLDTGTLAFKRYKWDSYYEIRWGEYVDSGKFYQHTGEPIQSRRGYIKRKYQNDAIEEELIYLGRYYQEWEQQEKLDAGYWKECD